MPLQPNTLAAAEDVNTVFSDIATALTNSLPTNGAAAMTGNLNMNGYNISGAGNIGTSTLTAASQISAGSLVVSGAAQVNGALSTYGGIYPNVGLFNIGGISGFNIQNNGGASLIQFRASNYIQFDGTNFSYTTTGTHVFAGWVQSNGNVTGANLTTGGTVVGAFIHSTGAVNADNGMTVSGTATFNNQVDIGTLYTVASIYAGGNGIIYSSYNGTNAFAFSQQGSYIYGWMNGGAVGSLVPPSTARVKAAIAPARLDCLEVVRRTPLFSFRRAGADADTPVGFVAEEQVKICPEMVMMHGEKPFGIDLMTAVATLYGAVQQLAQRAASPADRAR